ncbi:MAG: hypothetical protein PHY45_08265 [Rhodocyclaceae bacterium]|nr:hypothetical protein [Rhodocyclaceae bacterium]
MRRTFLTATLCCTLAACAGGYEWAKPGTAAAARDADLMACGSRTSHLDKDDPAAVAIVDHCMAARGYQKQKVR